MRVDNLMSRALDHLMGEVMHGGAAITREHAFDIAYTRLEKMTPLELLPLLEKLLSEPEEPGEG